MLLKVLKYYVALLLCIFNLLANAQDSHNLDSIRGISIFKLGTEKSVIKDLEIDTTQTHSSKNQSDYKYVGDFLSSIFDVKISRIVLTFYKNKLYNVSLYLGSKANPYSLFEYEQISRALEIMYGKNSNKLAMSGVKLMNGKRWEGTTVLLDHVRYAYADTKKKKLNVIEGNLSFTDLSIKQQIAANKDAL